MTKSDNPFNIELIRGNVFFLIVSSSIGYILYYAKYFDSSYSTYYCIFSTLGLFSFLVIFDKYRNPLRYSPRYVFFVRDRDDPIVKMEPYIDPLLSRLGLVKPEEFVNVRYAMYPELDVGLDLDPNTGVITGFPMEEGNHTSEIKMKFLGGQYSTKVRLEVVNTLRVKQLHKRDEFAPPRTVAQLLLREEDVLQRERDVDSDINRKRERLEDEYLSKEISLREQIDFERETFNTKLEGIEKEYKLKLKDRESTISDLKAEMISKLKELEDSKDLRIDKLEAEMAEALQNKEKEFVEFEKDIKSKYEDKEKSLSEEEEPVEEEPEEEVVEEEPVEEEPEEEVVEEEPEEESEEEEYDYISMTKVELVVLAKKRGLPVSGTKKKIIARLEEND